MDLFKKHKEKKKKAKENRGSFEKLLVGGEQVPVRNFYLHNLKDGSRYIELVAQTEVPQLHYNNVDIELITQTKSLKINADFTEAFQKSKFKVYRFKINTLNEFYI